MPSLMWMLSTVDRCAKLYQDDHLSDTELKPHHCRYLFSICRDPGLSQDQLAKRVVADKSQVARAVAYLEEHGYVTRSTGADKRVLLVSPTEKAISELPRLREIFRTWNEWLMEEFSPEEQEQFLRLMERARERAVRYTEIEGKDLPGKETEA